MQFNFYGARSVRGLSGKYRVLDYDRVLEETLIDEAIARVALLRDATPVRRGVTRDSWRISEIGPRQVGIFSTQWLTVKDLTQGTADGITPRKKLFMQWQGNGGYDGTFRRYSVHGQHVNPTLAAALLKVRTQALWSQSRAANLTKFNRDRLIVEAEQVINP